MILFMKKHIEKILITVGMILLMLFIVYMQKNSINTWETFIGFALSYFLLVPGMWIVSEKMKEKRKTLSIIIKVITIIECIALVRLFIACLFAV